MNHQHKNLAAGRWQEFSFFEQMANIGSEVERAIKWKNKDNAVYSQMAFDRALELLDLTIGVTKSVSHLKELLRLREILVDYFFCENIYSSSNEKWQKYFYAFNFAARKDR